MSWKGVAGLIALLIIQTSGRRMWASECIPSGAEPASLSDVTARLNVVPFPVHTLPAFSFRFVDWHIAALKRGSKTPALYGTAEAVP